MELVIDRRGCDEADGLLAGAFRILVAVDDSMRLGLAIDVLGNIDLATGGPDGGTLAARVAHHPEGRPDALLLAGGRASHAHGGLYASDAPGLGRHEVLAFDAGRRPSLGRRGGTQGRDLQGALAAELQVALAVGPALELIVVVGVAGDDVPVLLGGLVALLANKVGVEVACVAAIRRRIPGLGDGSEGGQGGQKLGEMHCQDRSTGRVSDSVGVRTNRCG